MACARSGPTGDETAVVALAGVAAERRDALEKVDRLLRTARPEANFGGSVPAGCPERMSQGERRPRTGMEFAGGGGPGVMYRSRREAVDANPGHARTIRRLDDYRETTRRPGIDPVCRETRMPVRRTRTNRAHSSRSRLVPSSGRRIRIASDRNRRTGDSSGPVRIRSRETRKPAHGMITNRVHSTRPRCVPLSERRIQVVSDRSRRTDESSRPVQTRSRERHIGLRRGSIGSIGPAHTRTIRRPDDHRETTRSPYNDPACRETRKPAR